MTEDSTMVFWTGVEQGYLDRAIFAYSLPSGSYEELMRQLGKALGLKMRDDLQRDSILFGALNNRVNNTPE